MWRWIVKQYGRRIVNVNVNIVFAGMIAMGLATIPVAVARSMGIERTQTALIGTIYAVADFLIDLVLVVLLHWMANHWPRKWKQTHELVNTAEHFVEQAGPPPLPFLKDATIIQIQRACLSPILYGSYGFLFLPIFKNRLQWNPEVACFTAMLCGVLVVRVLHTFWMLADERRWRRKWLAEVRGRGLGGAPSTGPAPMPPAPLGATPRSRPEDAPGAPGSSNGPSANGTARVVHAKHER